MLCDCGRRGFSMRLRGRYHGGGSVEIFSVLPKCDLCWADAIYEGVIAYQSGLQEFSISVEDVERVFDVHDPIYKRVFIDVCTFVRECFEAYEDTKKVVNMVFPSDIANIIMSYTT